MDTNPIETAQPISLTPQSTTPLWSTANVARHVGCSVRQVRNFRYAGMPAIKFRNLIRFEPVAVMAWLREQR